MTTSVYCIPSDKGVHSFYLKSEEGEFYLFSQPYRKGVQEYFSKGVTLKRASNFSKGHRDEALARTMTKIPMYIKYIEKEYDIQILNQTKKKHAQRHKNKCLCA